MVNQISKEDDSFKTVENPKHENLIQKKKSKYPDFVKKRRKRRD